LCPKLSLALREFEIPVTQEEEKEEERIIEAEVLMRSTATMSDSVSVILMRTCEICGLRFEVQKNEKICPRCALT